VLPWQALGGEFANFIARPRIPIPETACNAGLLLPTFDGTAGCSLQNWEILAKEDNPDANLGSPA
jgi:hypothetical protein